MKFSTLSLGLAVATSGFIAFSDSSNAAGITSVLGSSTVSGLIAFNDGTAPGYTFDAEGLLPAKGNIRQSNTGVHARPLSDGSKYLVVEPEGSGAKVAPLKAGAIFYNSRNLLSKFGIYWGSVDRSNKVEFYKGNTFIQAFTGESVFGNSVNFSSRTNPDANRFVTFTAASGSEFNRIKFSTGAIAFEFDSKPVPVPAIVPGIALAAAFFGSTAIKRNKKNANESVA